MVCNVNDIYIGRSLDLYGEYSQGETDLFLQFLRPGMVVVEVGANIGAHTVPLAQAVWPRGAVLAFEPQRIVFQTLCANLAVNSIVNVDARPAAVGAAPGTLLVPVLDCTLANNFGGLGLGTHTVGEPVSVVTLDSLDLGRCDLLKVDAEGMEKDVLDGASATLARHRPLLYVENDRQDKSAELIRAIHMLGYRMYWHRPYLFSAANFAGNPDNVFGNIASLNMLCLPADKANFTVDGFEPVAVPDA
jgi:FkbM family methyltransferase